MGDWRRNQVDGLISAVYGLVHQSGRVFGVSPIALPEKCRTTAYADVAAWMRQPGYIDYICPQIYFGFENTASPFAGNLAMWAALPRRTGVRLYIGLALYKAGLPNDPYAGGGQAEWAQHSDILARQVAALRAGRAGRRLCAVPLCTAGCSRCRRSGRAAKPAAVDAG